MPSILLILMGIFIFSSFVGLTFFMQSKHDETIKKQRDQKRETDLMFKRHWDMIQRHKSIDYFEKYGYPKQKGDEEQSISEEGPVVIQDLGNGHGLGPDGDIYIISKRGDKNG